jgi:hypothetical protein
VRSTKPTGFSTLGEDSEPPPLTQIEKKGDILVTHYKLGEDGRLSSAMFSDQTGAFHVCPAKTTSLLWSSIM